jgi:hypothetical protein
MAFFILPLLSVEGWWQGQYEKGHVLIYLSHILPGHKRANNMLLPRRQITRHKLCFYYTCKFGVISIKYVINSNNVTCQKRKGVMLCALAKYVINRLIHGLFHIALVISPRLISSLGLKPSGPISRSCTDNKGNMKKAMY